jgi:hypothetical protein
MQKHTPAASHASRRRAITQPIQVASGVAKIVHTSGRRYGSPRSGSPFGPNVVRY